MKDLFGILKNEKESTYNRFVIRELSSEREEIISKNKDIKNYQKKQNFRNIYNQTMFFFLLISFMTIIPMLIAKDGFINALKDRGYIFIIGIISFIIFLVLFVIYLNKKQRNKDEVETKQIEMKIASLENDCKRELNIPFNVNKIDIFLSKVKNKNGNEKSGNSIFANLQFMIYKDENNLYIADIHRVIALPLIAFKEIKKIKKSIVFQFWNKKDSYKSEKYKSYKIRSNNGLFFSKTYYVIYLKIDNEDFKINIPNYDLDTFLEVLNLKVEE